MEQETAVMRARENQDNEVRSIPCGRWARRVAHMTSVHRVDDPRILVKECGALSAAGFSVSLLARAERDHVRGGVRIRAIRRAKGRFQRMTLSMADALRRALREPHDVYHLHDPELIPVGLLLKLAGRRVIYDAHEDLRMQVMGKAWLPRPLRPLAARLAALLDFFTGRFFDAVVAATPQIARRYPAHKTVTVQNFPVLGELDIRAKPPSHTPGTLVYVGGVTISRGAREMIDAVALVPEELNPRLVLIGELAPGINEVIHELPGRRRTETLGWRTRSEIAELLTGASAGLVVLHPAPNYVESYPTKLFEYMSAGLPVIASDFPLWRRIVEEAECGITVDPLDPAAIAAAATRLLRDPEEAEEMGRRGVAAVRTRYNWETEGEKLVALYRRLTGGP